jgi:sugar lactone lactonase YvrE
MKLPTLGCRARLARTVLLASFAFAALLPSFAFATALYVADSGNNTVYSVNDDGKKTAFVRGLSVPVGLAFDTKNNLFVACSPSIVKISYARVTTNFAGTFFSPSALVRNRLSGDLFVANSGNGIIYKIPPSGIVAIFLSTGLASLQGLAFDAIGNLYCLDAASGQILKITPGGSARVFKSGYINGRALAFDKYDSLYVADSGQNVVFKISPDGSRSIVVSGLLQPSGLAFDDIGNLFVANAGSGIITKITPDGHQSTYSAGFDHPAGLAFGVDPATSALPTPSP